MLLRMSLVLFLVAIPLMAQSPEEVINLAVNHSLEEDEPILDDEGWADWYTWNDPAGAGSNVEFDETEFIDGTRSLRIEPKGVENWHFIVANDGNAVKQGDINTVSFWAKAEETRPLGVQMKATDNTVSFGYNDFVLSTEWAEYHFSTEAQASPIKVEFFCAAPEVTFWIDFLYVYQDEYVEGILPSELTIPEALKPAGKLPIRWAELKLAQ